LITNESELTALQVNVLQDLAHGLAPSQIAAKRSLSAPLSEDCVNELYVKLGASSRQNLIAKAYVRGFIDEAAFDAAVMASITQDECRQTSCFP
jgi:DNA-binding NarL/FixJ family response regulator